MQLDIQETRTLDACADISINEDVIFENTEMFAVSLTSDDILLCSSGTMALVSITDSTGMDAAGPQSYTGCLLCLKPKEYWTKV